METVSPFLLREGFLREEDVVETPTATFQVLDYSRRNRVFKVIPPSGEGGLLVKQAMDPRSADYASSLLVESRMLEAVARDPALQDLRWFSPRYVHHDAESGVLLTELIHPATTVSRDNLNLGEVVFQEDSAVTCGRLLANFHRLGTKAWEDGLLPFVPRGEPFIFMDEARVDDLLRGGRHQREFASFLRASAFWKALPAARAAWGKKPSLIHRDPRWDNFLLTHGNAPGGNLNIRLIDWELSCVGDAAWDVAYYLCEHVRFWLLNCASDANVRTLEGYHATSKFKIESCHPAAKAFLDAYCRRAKLERRGRAELLERVRALLPFNLALIAYEALMLADRMPWVYPVALAAAEEAHRDPAAFLARHMGVTE